MKLNPRKAVFAVLTLFVLSLFAIALAFVLGKIPPNAWLGLQPDDATVGEAQWYAINQIGGFALLFCAINTGVFLLAMRKIKVTTVKVVLYTLLALFLSAILASLLFNYLLKFITI